MKTILRILPVLLLIAGLSGCSAQKPAVGTGHRGAGPDALSGGRAGSLVRAGAEGVGRASVRDRGR